MTEPTNEQTLPEMQPGSTGMYSISAADGIKMGPAVLQAFMGKLREAAELAQLEVKVEPLRGILMIWWYPKEEETFLDQLAEHMGAVPQGYIEVPWVVAIAGMSDETTLEQLQKALQIVGQNKLTVIEVTEMADIDEEKHVRISWGFREYTKEDLPNRTYLDAVAEEFDKAPSGELTASRKNMLESKKNMTEVMEYFMDVSSAKNLDIVADYAVDSDEVKISWKPMSREVLGESDGTLDNEPKPWDPSMDVDPASHFFDPEA